MASPTSQMRPLEIIVRALFLVAPLVLLFFVVRIVVANVEISRTHIKTTAEVLSSERIETRGYRDRNRVQVRLAGPDGPRAVNLQDTKTRFEVGEQIAVFYKPETMDPALDGGFYSMWWDATVLTLISLALLFVGLRRRRARSYAESA